MSWHQDGRIHVTWGPEGEKLSPEEQEKMAAELMAEGEARREEHDAAIKALEGMPFIAVPVDQLADIYERMLRLVKMGQSSLDDWSTKPKELMDLRSAVFRQADFGAVYAGQWLPRDIQDAIRKKVQDEIKAAASGANTRA